MKKIIRYIVLKSYKNFINYLFYYKPELNNQANIIKIISN